MLSEAKKLALEKTAAPRIILLDKYGMAGPPLIFINLSTAKKHLREIMLLLQPLTALAGLTKREKARNICKKNTLEYSKEFAEVVACFEIESHFAKMFEPLL